MKKVKVESQSRKSKSTKIDIDHVAKLANLELTAEEKNIFSKQLKEILKYVEMIEKVNTANTEPTFNVSPSKNVTRKDVVGTSLTQEETLANASSKEDGYFVTKGVFKNE